MTVHRRPLRRAPPHAGGRSTIGQDENVDPEVGVPEPASAPSGKPSLATKYRSKASVAAIVSCRSPLRATDSSTLSVHCPCIHQRWKHVVVSPWIRRAKPLYGVKGSSLLGVCCRGRRSIGLRAMVTFMSPRSWGHRCSSRYPLSERPLKTKVNRRSARGPVTACSFSGLGERKSFHQPSLPTRAQCRWGPSSSEHPASGGLCFLSHGGTLLFAVGIRIYGGRGILTVEGRSLLVTRVGSSQCHEHCLLSEESRCERGATMGKQALLRKETVAEGLDRRNPVATSGSFAGGHHASREAQPSFMMLASLPFSGSCHRRVGPLPSAERSHCRHSMFFRLMFIGGGFWEWSEFGRPGLSKCSRYVGSESRRSFEWGVSVASVAVSTGTGDRERTGRGSNAG